MAPKKKGNKKADDDWEAELGETVDPIAAAVKEAKEAEASKDADDDGAVGSGGGLLAALKKNKSKKQKKGKTVDEDYLDGEDPSATNGADGPTEPDSIIELASKAPVEANTDELFDAPSVKTKGGKGKQGKTEVEVKEDEEISGGEGGGLKSKKEKEKEKKEREKQRKKEQVQLPEYSSLCILEADRITMLGRQEENHNTDTSTKASQRSCRSEA